MGGEKKEINTQIMTLVLVIYFIGCVLAFSCLEIGCKVTTSEFNKKDFWLSIVYSIFSWASAIIAIITAIEVLSEQIKDNNTKNTQNEKI